MRLVRGWLTKPTRSSRKSIDSSNSRCSRNGTNTVFAGSDKESRAGHRSRYRDSALTMARLCGPLHLTICDRTNRVNAGYGLPTMPFAITNWQTFSGQIGDRVNLLAATTTSAMLPSAEGYASMADSLRTRVAKFLCSERRDEFAREPRCASP
jgi:hypothetical protein